MTNRLFRCANYTKIDKKEILQRKDRNEKIDNLVDKAFEIYGEAIKKLGKT